MDGRIEIASRRQQSYKAKMVELASRFSRTRVDPVELFKPKAAGDYISAENKNYWEKRFIPGGAASSLIAGIGTLAAFGAAHSPLALGAGAAALGAGAVLSLISYHAVLAGSAGTKLAKELEEADFNVFLTWVKERYGVTIDLRDRMTNPEALKRAATWGLNSGPVAEEDKPSYIVFAGTNRKTYVLRRNPSGELCVHSLHGTDDAGFFHAGCSSPSKHQTLGTVTNLGELTEVKPKPQPKLKALSEVKAIEPTSSEKLLAELKAKALKLRAYDLNVTEEHTVERALKEANESVALHQKMVTLEDGEPPSDEILVALLAGLLGELKQVSRSLHKRLDFELKVNSDVVNERTQKGISLDKPEEGDDEK